MHDDHALEAARGDVRNARNERQLLQTRWCLQVQPGALGVDIGDGLRSRCIHGRNGGRERVLLGEVRDTFDINPVVEERRSVGALRLRGGDEPGGVAAHADAEQADLSDGWEASHEVLRNGDRVSGAFLHEPSATAAQIRRLRAVTPTVVERERNRAVTFGRIAQVAHP